VLTDAATDMVITKEETFGPVAPLYRFKTDAEAISMANEAPTLTLPRAREREGRGLAAYFCSRDIGRIWRVAGALEYGIVGIIEGIISTEIARSCGMKESGIGPIWRSTGARNTASRNSSKSNTSAWAASTIEVWESAPGVGIYRALTPGVQLSQMFPEGMRVKDSTRARRRCRGLFNNVVGSPKYGVRNFQAEYPCSLQIND
jgi:hypothetical protein